MTRTTMLKACLGPLLALTLLVGCGEEENPVLGTWKGTITEVQRQGLEIETALAENRFEIAFREDTATVNGEALRVAYNKNGQHHFINEIGSNRTMSAIFLDPNKIELRIPHHFKRKLFVFELTRSD